MISATHLHAMIVHFPIALLLAGFLSEVIGFTTKKEFFRNAAGYLLMLGALGSIAAYFSGDFAGEGIEEGPLEGPMELHEQAAIFTLWLSIAAAVFKAGVFYFKTNLAWTRWTGILLFAAVVGAVSYTGYLGGQLVYKHGAGVDLALPDFNTSAGKAEEDD
jgi:uncharacterized membrane protein